MMMAQRSVLISDLVTSGNALRPTLPSFPSWPFPGPSFCCSCQPGFVNSTTTVFSCLVSTTTTSGLLAAIAAIAAIAGFSSFLKSWIVVLVFFFFHHSHQAAWLCSMHRPCLHVSVSLHQWSPSPPEASLLFQQGYISKPQVKFPPTQMAFTDSPPLQVFHYTADIIAST